MNSGYDNTYGSDDGSDLVKDLRKQLKEQSARFKELEEELTGFKSSARTNELSAALQEAGYPETVARFVPDDLSTEDLGELMGDDQIDSGSPADAPGMSIEDSGEESDDLDDNTDDTDEDEE